MVSLRLAPPVVRGLDSAAGDRPSSFPTNGLGWELSIVRSSTGMDPEGVLLNIDTSGPSWAREPAEAATLSILRSSWRSNRDDGRLPDDWFSLSPLPRDASGTWLSIALPAFEGSRTAPQWPHWTASAGFSTLQEGQIMIEGWLEVRHLADYPARLSPSASNICAIGVDTTSTRCDFPSGCKIDPWCESHL